MGGRGRPQCAVAKAPVRAGHRSRRLATGPPYRAARPRVLPPSSAAPVGRSCSPIPTLAFLRDVALLTDPLVKDPARVLGKRLLDSAGSTGFAFVVCSDGPCPGNFSKQILGRGSHHRGKAISYCWIGGRCEVVFAQLIGDGMTSVEDPCPFQIDALEACGFEILPSRWRVAVETGAGEYSGTTNALDAFGF